jgi:uncharacterized protein
MPESIVWRRPPRRRRQILLLLVLLAVVVFGGRTALSYYVDALWFGSLGYGDVFRKTLGLEWAVFAAFALVTFLILYGRFLALKRAHLGDLPASRMIIFGGQPVKLPVEPILRLAALSVSLVIALVTGASMMTEWPMFARYWYAAQTGGGVTDPIFHKPLNFYLFTLPAWDLITDWLMVIAVITLGGAVFFFLISGGTRAISGRRDSYMPLPRRGLSLTFAFLLLILAMRAFINRFEQLFGDHTIFSGVTYTDAHVMLTGMLVVCVALVLGAAIAVVSAVSVARERWLVGAIVPAAVCYLALQ